ncbi:MAG: hypothetical protein V5A51_06320 [Bacteroidales bacterium]|nr:hypothetical protein [Bacteroidales bacterium]MBS3776658.1 hypothetical protein [Bacteroidales bacterium]
MREEERRHDGTMGRLGDGAKERWNEKTGKGKTRRRENGKGRIVEWEKSDD